MDMFSMLFPKLFTSIDGDPGAGGGDPAGQPDPTDQGTPATGGEDSEATPPTEFIDVKGVKIPASEFEQLAKEKYKDRFDAYDNREKWQAENTRKAQELAEYRREVEESRRLMAQLRAGKQEDPVQKMKREYVEDMKRQFPDIDDRFLEAQFNWQMKLAESRAKDSLDPFLERQGQEYERKFLADHPKLQKGSREYHEILEMTQSGVDPERAYQIVFFDDIVKEKQEAAIKQREDESLRKLKENKTSSSQATLPKAKSFDEVFERAFAKHGDK